MFRGLISIDSKPHGSQGIFLFLTILPKLIRKPDSEAVTPMIPELDASQGIFLFLAALSERIRKPYLEHMVLMISRLGSSMSQNSLKNKT
mgnify:CR=1 FL=1